MFGVFKVCNNGPIYLYASSRFPDYVIIMDLQHLQNDQRLLILASTLLFMADNLLCKHVRRGHCVPAQQVKCTYCVAQQLSVVHCLKR